MDDAKGENGLRKHYDCAYAWVLWSLLKLVDLDFESRQEVRWEDLSNFKRELIVGPHLS